MLLAANDSFHKINKVMTKNLSSFRLFFPSPRAERSRAEGSQVKIKQLIKQAIIFIVNFFI